MRPTLLYKKKGARKAKAKRPPKYRTEAKAAFKAAYESLFGSQGAASLINWEPRSHPRGSAAPSFSPSPRPRRSGPSFPPLRLCLSLGGLRFRICPRFNSDCDRYCQHAD